MKKIVIFGSGEIGQLAHFYFASDSDRTVAAFTLDGSYIQEPSFCGLPVVPFETVESNYPPQEYEMFVAVGYRQVNELRARKVAEARAKGYKLASYISSRATILTQEPIGDNCFLLEDNTIQPFVKIGENVTLWSGNHVGHHSSIGDGCFITSHVVISGGVCVEPNCFIGVNATIRDHIRIGASCVIGAGAIILADAPARTVFKSAATEISPVPSNRLRGI